MAFHFFTFILWGNCNIFKIFLIFFARKNLKKPPSKVAHNQPNFFQYCQLAQNQHKIQFLFHKNCSPCDLCVMALVVSVWQHFLQLQSGKKSLQNSLLELNLFSPVCNSAILYFDISAYTIKPLVNKKKHDY